MSIKVMRQALEALENSIDMVRHEYEADWRHGIPTRKAQLHAMKQALDDHESVIPALRQAIADAQEADELTIAYMSGMHDGKIAGWNAALNEAAARIANVRGFGQATQDSFAVYINGLKK